MLELDVAKYTIRGRGRRQGGTPIVLTAMQHLDTARLLDRLSQIAASCKSFEGMSTTRYRLETLEALWFRCPDLTKMQLSMIVARQRL